MAHDLEHGAMSPFPPYREPTPPDLQVTPSPFPASAGESPFPASAGESPFPASAGEAAATGQRHRARDRSRGPAAEPLQVPVDVARLSRWLQLLTVALVVLDVAASVGSAAGAPYVITRFFDGDSKTNVPSGYKIFGLCTVALLAAALARSGRDGSDRFASGWRIIAWVAAFACFDETTYLHQSLSGVLTTRLDLHGPLRYSWTIVYLPAAAAVGVAMLRYVRFLEPGLRLRVLSGGAVYAFAAVAFEPVKSEVSEDLGETGLPFKLVSAASDSLEMVGITVLIVVLVGRLAATRGGVVLHGLPDR